MSATDPEWYGRELAPGRLEAIRRSIDANMASLPVETLETLLELANHATHLERERATARNGMAADLERDALRLERLATLQSPFVRGVPNQARETNRHVARVLRQKAETLRAG